ncbi:MAG: esterase family protein [Dysgonamonadaceae bacterium]|jgi:enterochelin esterase-like enzyme|nr:esterase family protein [Dysgonamonadaceae bacterium]
MKKISLLFAMAVFAVSVVSAQNGVVYETRSLTSKILKSERRYAIYLPPGYEGSDRSYPVLYLLHGSGDNHTGWVQFGHVQHIADKTIADGISAPMIIVMPDADTQVKGYFNQPDGSFSYEDFFFDELIPHIEKTYRVRSEQRYRAVSGLSMGGGGTIFYALHHPEMFAAAAPLSATTGANWLLRNPNASDAQKEEFGRVYGFDYILNNASKEELDRIKRVRWYVSVGDDDFLYKDNSLLHIQFRDKAIPHEYRVKDGAHTWTYWRMELPLVLEFVSKSFMQY